MNKTCSKCKDSKSLKYFNNDKKYSDGKYPSCKDCKKQVFLKYYQQNKDVLIKTRVEKHKQDLLKPEYRERHNKKCLEWSKMHDRSVYMRNYAKNKLKTDINFKLACNLRSRLYCALFKQKKSGSAVKDLGCSVDDLKIYLESKFQPGMTWENHGNRVGTWSIDHILPLSKFNLSKREELVVACHYTNLQPMWCIDNIRKSNKTAKVLTSCADSL